MRYSVLSAGLLVLAAWGQTTYRPQVATPRLMTQPLMSPEEVASAEAQVQANPEDLNLRLRLLTQYRDTAPVPPNDDPIRRQARLQHILYLIWHFPDGFDPASPLLYVFRSGGPYANANDHEMARLLWARSVDSIAMKAPRVLNAARFLFVEDKQEAEQVLKRAVQNDTANQHLAANLGFIYAMQILGLDNFAADVTAAIPESEREQARTRATSELGNSSNPAVLAGAATAIPNLSIRASRGQAVDPELFQFASRLMARARTLAPSDEAFRGPMPMIEYFQEAQGSSKIAPRGLPPIFKTLPSKGSCTGEPGITGALVASDPQTVAPQPAPSGIRIAGNVQAAKLLRRPLPTYPELAKKSGIEGNVRLEAIINRDGTINGLTTISGHPLLVPAALDAVKQWVYQPTLLNGTPVEVITDIIVSFPPK